MSAFDRALRPADLPLVRAIRQRRHPAPVYEAVLVEPETQQEQLFRLLIAIAPMAFAFFYLAVMSVFLFR